MTITIWGRCLKCKEAHLIRINEVYCDECLAKDPVTIFPPPEANS